ncbi:MAG: benzoate rane transport protein [Pseudomonadota bacterium]|jgi:benzoate membrane transport protein|nr:benzoate rane transport protein [Pseudomonadota bacterium]
MKCLRDLSLSALSAGFVTVLVGFASSAVIVFQAAHALGASQAQLASWLWALGLGMGGTCIVLSLRYRMPISTAWSTAGAAMLITSVSGLSMNEAIGAFLVSACLIIVSGFSGWFERAIQRIPLALAAGMMSGVLLRFGLNAFVAMQTEFALSFGMFVVYLLGRRWWPRYAVILALLAGLLTAAGRGMLHLQAITVQLGMPVFTMPAFSWAALIGVALPLFVVTMASQNVPGIGVLRAAGYRPPVSKLIGWLGVVNLLLAPFGAYALNLSTITAAIVTGPEAHPDPDKRYMAGVAAGVFYTLMGLFGATVAATLLALPKELVWAIAGFALLGTIGNGLLTALNHERHREAALVTFLVTASGITLLGVGSAFWGLLGGVLVLLLLHGGR